MPPDVLNRLLSAARAALSHGLRGVPSMAIAIEVIPSCSSSDCANVVPYVDAWNGAGAGGQISSGGTGGSTGGAGGQTTGGSGGASADASLDGPPSDASHIDGSKPTDSSTPSDSSVSRDSSASGDSAVGGPG